MFSETDCDCYKPETFSGLWQNCFSQVVPEDLCLKKKYFANEFCNRERCRLRGMEARVGEIINSTSPFVFFDVTFLTTRERGASAASLPLSLLPSQGGITKPLTTPSPFYFLSFINTTILV